MSNKKNLPAKIDAQVIPVNERTILVKLPDARKLVKNYLATELPTAISAKYDEDRDLRQQVVGLTDFILEHFKTISINEVRKAIDLNSAQALPENTGHYGRIDREFIGAVLRNYMTWRQNQHQVNGLQQLKAAPKTVPQLLDEDIRKIKFYGESQSITTDVEAKYDYLVKNAPDFIEVDLKAPANLVALEEIKASQKKGILAGSKFLSTPEETLNYKLKAEQIKKYLRRRLLAK